MLQEFEELMSYKIFKANYKNETNSKTFFEKHLKTYLIEVSKLKVKC